MDFSDVYKLACKIAHERVAAGKKPAVTFIQFRDQVIANVDWLTGVNVWKVDCEPGDPLGHYECHSETESAYEVPEKWAVRITYDSKCNTCWKRMVWTKELMHVFDTEEGFVSAENYVGFLQEVEVTPPDNKHSPAYNSENNAKWMALLCLCPKAQRDAAKAKLEAGHITPYDMALEFRIPQDYINALVSDNYDTALRIFVKQD